MTREVSSAYAAHLRRRAEIYARHPLIRRPRLRLRFAAFAGVRPSDRVLDVATGPGYNAFAFARKASEVTGVDTAPERLDQAQRQAARRRLGNLAFHQAEPEDLPFPDDSFDIVTSSGAVHHFDSPARAFAEMARVCLPGGKLAIEDVVASEQNVRARYHNRLERLRDRTHRRLLPLSEIIALLGQGYAVGQGLRLRKLEMMESLREFNEWIAVAGTPPRRAEHIRRLLQGSVERDLSGLGMRPVDDTFLFVQQVAWVLAMKPE